MTPFHALPGLYQVLFLYLEPLSTILPALLAWTYPGAGWFHQQLIPVGLQYDLGSLDLRTSMAIWQLANCYLLLSLISSFVIRAVRDGLPQNPRAQERIVGSSLAALAIADVTQTPKRCAIRCLEMEQYDTWQYYICDRASCRKVGLVYGHKTQTIRHR